MAQRGRATDLDERVAIGERADTGQTDAEIATATGRSKWTVRKWRRKYQGEGRLGLASPMGRPPTGALGQCSAEIRDTVRQMREQHPGWGPLTIRVEMENDERFKGLHLPSRPRIAAFLHQERLTRPYERHTELPQPPPETAKYPHDEWEADAEGAVTIPDLGKVSLINIGDLVSRLKVDSLACLNVSHPSTWDYQLSFRRAFVQYGLPLRVSLDHDSVFYDNACASPYPTTIHLWLVALGIDVYFIEHRPPIEHSVIERTHQTVDQQAIAGQQIKNGTGLQQNLDNRRDFLNRLYPSRALGHRPPLVAYPDARHSGRPYRLEWEEAMLDLQRVYDYLTQGHWFRRASPQGQFSLGSYRYNVGVKLGEQMLEITFAPQTREFVCLTEDGRRKVRLAAQGLTKPDLMGELNRLTTRSPYQLALPFSRTECREMILSHALTGPCPARLSETLTGTSL